MSAYELRIVEYEVAKRGRQVNYLIVFNGNTSQLVYLNTVQVVNGRLICMNHFICTYSFFTNDVEGGEYEMPGRATFDHMFEKEQFLTILQKEYDNLSPLMQLALGRELLC